MHHAKSDSQNCVVSDSVCDNSYQAKFTQAGIRIKGFRSGVIAVDRDGKRYNTEGMVRGITTNALDPTVTVY